MQIKKILSAIASIGTSLSLVLIFYLLAISSDMNYNPVDIYGGMVFVFILSMIISASIWPSLLKKLKSM